jgi:hypothetical protein
MSFEKMSKKDLVAVAEEFGVSSAGTKETILAELEADGVTFELYQSLEKAGGDDEGAETAPEPTEVVGEYGVYGLVEGEDTVLAYRSNQGSYGNVYGNWSVKSPFFIVAKSVADGMIDEMPGLFEVASDTEVEAFYN